MIDKLYDDIAYLEDEIKWAEAERSDYMDSYDSMNAWGKSSCEIFLDAMSEKIVNLIERLDEAKRKLEDALEEKGS